MILTCMQVAYCRVSEGLWEGPRFQDRRLPRGESRNATGSRGALHDKHSAGLRSLLSRPGSGVLSNFLFFLVLS